MMKRTGRLQYKCRRCGEIFESGPMGGDMDLMVVRLTLEDNFYMPCATVTAKELHHCTTTEPGIGIADVVGARYDTEAEVPHD